MNPIDVFNNSRGLNDFLTTLYGPRMTQQQRQDGTNMYNRFQSIRNGTNGGTPTNGGYTGNNNTGNNSGGLKGGFNIITDFIGNITKGIGGVLNDINAANIGQGTNTDLNVTTKVLESIRNNGISVNSILDNIGEAYNLILSQQKQESELQSEINSKTTITGKLSEGLRDDMIASSSNAALFGLSLKNLGEIYTTMVKESGKFSLINRETLDMAAPTIRVFTDGAEDLGRAMVEFEKVGLGANKTIKTIQDAGQKSITLGLNGKKTVEDIRGSLDKINQYGFKNGIDGLAQMTRKATEFRMGIQEAFTIAEKVMNPEGALELSANLQVLGGAIGDFNDPLKLMYMATNNVEGLQDALIGAAGSLATYNKEQGRFEITGINLRKAKEMAIQLGINYQELAKGAIAAAERSSAAAAIMSNGLRMKPEDKEFLTNLSQMEGGEMVIKVPESLAKQLGIKTNVMLSELDQRTANALLENKKDFEKMSTEDIAKAQLTEIEQMGRNVDAIVQYERIQALRNIRGGTRGVARAFGLDGLDKEAKEFLTREALIRTKAKTDPNVEQRATIKAENFTNDKIITPAKTIYKKGKEYLDDPGELLNDIKDAIKDGFELIRKETSFNQPKQRISIESNITTSNPGDYLTTKNIKNV